MKNLRKSLLIGILTISVLCLNGCAWLDSEVHEIVGAISGNSYTVETYDNYGELQMTTRGEKINVRPNIIESISIDEYGNIITNYELSSVLTLTIDGYEMESCGDTLVFYEDGLKPDVTFEKIENINSESEDFADNTLIAGTLNSVKNLIGKSRVVVIKSSLGQPIYAFSGDKVYWNIPDDLPKFTKITIDGKSLYLHRCNYQIIDKELIK